MPIYPGRPRRRRPHAQVLPISVEPEIGSLNTPEFLGSPEPEAGSSPGRSGPQGPGEPMASSPVQPDGPGGSEVAGSLEYEDLEADATGRAPAESDWNAEQAVRALRDVGQVGKPHPGKPSRGPEEESAE